MPVIAVLAAGCNTPEDAVRETMARVESAAVHGDRETLFLLHHDSVDGGPFCAPSFAAAWQAGGRATPEVCDQARLVRETPAAGGEEAQLLALTLDFRCSHPEGSCQDLARAAFLSRVAATPGALDSLEVNRIEVRDDGQSAAVHSTLYRAAGEKTRAVFTLKRVGARWLLTSAPF